MARATRRTAPSLCYSATTKAVGSVFAFTCAAVSTHLCFCVTGSCLASSTSTDGGNTWSPIAFNPQLRNPTAQAAVIGGSDGRSLYVSTPYSSDHSLQGHNNLSLLQSTANRDGWSTASVGCCNGMPFCLFLERTKLIRVVAEFSLEEWFLCSYTP